MLQQIRLLTAVQLCNLFGINEVRYSKDPVKRKRSVGMGILYMILILILWGYLGAFSYGMILLGIGEVVPYYLYMIASLVILFFSFFKAASVIFQRNTYEMLISLPVSKAAIVTSRFLMMYATDLLLSLTVMFPGIILYGILMKPSPIFYIWSLIGTLFLPCLPLAIATAVGSLIYAVSSRMRHKNLASICLSLVFIIVILVFSFGITGNPEMMEQITPEMIRHLAVMLIAQIQKIYPPAGWFGSSAVDKNLGAAGLLIVVSIAAAGILMAVLQKYFTAISSALNATSAKNNYKMGSLAKSSIIKALWKREIKRYFSSSIYVTNTLVGYIMLVLLAIALCFTDIGHLMEIMELPADIDILPILPFVLALVGNLMPITACSISMEGKQWWIYQTLPITMKQVLDGKILLNLSIALPFFAAADVAALIAVRPSLIDGLWMILVTFVYTVFLSVLGLSINLAVPVFKWENEVRIVKQSAATTLTLLLNFVSGIIPIILIFLLKDAKDAVTGGALVVFTIVTILLYHRNQKIKL